ncbi:MULTISPECIES: hypothetical protein [unclassified Leifsonia]|uniref:hypothetical protein n=1 Tax=unclassified Leifsonia TaxID=2663824 RepID=UPI0006F78568|nr:MULTISPECIES: hypothetical protein [unclassified Leifsonia]KQX07146.1 hypothetical protein ASC59_04925 [Leifsonia sp. Root1293]KRA11429.1 hypothetical protein ASD61_04925 [Leifsonia sp. Root60]
MSSGTGSVPAMKRCFRCSEEKPVSEFNASTKTGDGLHSYCRACQHQHYLDNRDRHMDNVRRSRDARRDQARTLVAETFASGCVDCGTTDIRVLQFDHVRGEKLNAVSTMIRVGRSLASITAEIAKCEVRCANCHTIATLVRLGASWHDRFMTG